MISENGIDISYNFLPLPDEAVEFRFFDPSIRISTRIVLDPSQMQELRSLLLDAIVKLEIERKAVLATAWQQYAAVQP